MRGRARRGAHSDSAGRIVSNGGFTIRYHGAPVTLIPDPKSYPKTYRFRVLESGFCGEGMHACAAAPSEAYVVSAGRAASGGREADVLRVWDLATSTAGRPLALSPIANLTPWKPSGFSHRGLSCTVQCAPLVFLYRRQVHP